MVKKTVWDSSFAGWPVDTRRWGSHWVCIQKGLCKKACTLLSGGMFQLHDYMGKSCCLLPRTHHSINTQCRMHLESSHASGRLHMSACDIQLEPSLSFVWNKQSDSRIFLLWRNWSLYSCHEQMDFTIFRFSVVETFLQCHSLTDFRICYSKGGAGTSELYPSLLKHRRKMPHANSGTSKQDNTLGDCIKFPFKFDIWVRWHAERNKCTEEQHRAFESQAYWKAFRWRDMLIRYMTAVIEPTIWYPATITNSYHSAHSYIEELWDDGDNKNLSHENWKGLA